MEKINHYQALGRMKPELDPNMYRVSKMMEVLQKLQDSERKNEELLTQIVALKEQAAENAALRMATAENAALKELAAHNRDLMNQVSEKVAENAALREGVVVYSMMSKELKQQLFNATSELWRTRDESKSKHVVLLGVNDTLKRQLRTATLQLCQIRKKMHHRLRREAAGSTDVEVEKELEDLKIQIREMGEEMKCSYIKDKVRVQQTEILKNQIWKLEEKMSCLQEDSLKKEVKLDEGVKLLNQQITDLQELVMRTDSDMSEFEKVKLELREQKLLEKEDHLESEEEKEFSALAAEIEALKDQVSEKEAEILYRDVWIQTIRNNLNFSHSALYQLTEERKHLVETTSGRRTEMEREIEDLKTMVNEKGDVPPQHHENLENGWEEHDEGLQETCEEETRCSFLEEEPNIQETEDLKNQIRELEEEISALQEDSLLKESHLEEEVQLLNQFQELVFRTDEYKVELKQVKQELEEKRKQETEKQLEREKKEEEMSVLAAVCGTLKEQLSKREEELKNQDAWIQTFRKDLNLSNSTLYQLIEERKHLVETTRPMEAERTTEDLKEMQKEESLSAEFQLQHQEDLMLANGWGLNSEETSEEEMMRSSFLEDKAPSVHQTEDLKIQIRESYLEDDPLGEESMLDEGVKLLNQEIMELQELVLRSDSDVPEFQKVKLELREKIKSEMEGHFESEVEKEFSALAEEIEALKEQVSEKDAEILHRDVGIKTFRSNLNFSNSVLHQLLEERKHLVEEESARQTEMEREIEDLKTMTTEDEEEFLVALQLQHQENPVLENGWEVTPSEGLQEISEEEEMRSSSLKEEPNQVQQTEDLKNQIRELEKEMSARQEDSLRRESKLEEEVQLLNQQNMDLQGLVFRAGEEIVGLEKLKLELEEKKKQEMEISTLAVETEALREKLSKKEEEIKYQDAWIQSLRKDLNLSNSALHQLVQTARQAEMEKVIEDLRTMVREEGEDRQLPHQENGWKVNSECLQETPEQEMRCSLLKDKVQQTGNVRNQIRKMEEMSPLRKESRQEEGVKLLNQQIMESQELVLRSNEYKAELGAVKLELGEKKKQEREEQLEKERKEEEMSALVVEIEALKEQLSKREEELKDQDAWIQTFRKNLSFSNSTLHHLIEERKHLDETFQELVVMADNYKAELKRVKTELEEGKKNQQKEEQLEEEKKGEDLSALAAEIKALKEQVSEKETEIEYQDVWIKTIQKNLNLCNETLQQLVRERKHLVETAGTRQREMKREIEGLKMMLREEGQIPIGSGPQLQHKEEQEETKGTRLQNLEQEVHHFRYMDCSFGKTSPPPFPDLTPKGDEEKEPREKKRKWEKEELKEPERQLKRKIKDLRQKLDKKMEEQERKRVERERKKEEEREGNKQVMIVAPSFAQRNST